MGTGGLGAGVSGGPGQPWRLKTPSAVGSFLLCCSWVFTVQCGWDTGQSHLPHRTRPHHGCAFSAFFSDLPFPTGGWHALARAVRLSPPHHSMLPCVCLCPQAAAGPSSLGVATPEHSSSPSLCVSSGHARRGHSPRFGFLNGTVVGHLGTQGWPRSAFSPSGRHLRTDFPRWAGEMGLLSRGGGRGVFLL